MYVHCSLRSNRELVNTKRNIILTFFFVEKNLFEEVQTALGVSEIIIFIFMKKIIQIKMEISNILLNLSDFLYLAINFE